MLGKVADLTFGVYPSALCKIRMCFVIDVGVGQALQSCATAA